MKPYFCYHSELSHRLSLKHCQYSNILGHSKQLFQEIAMINVFLFSGFHFRGTILEPSLTAFWRKRVDISWWTKKLELFSIVWFTESCKTIYFPTQDVEFWKKDGYLSKLLSSQCSIWLRSHCNPCLMYFRIFSSKIHWPRKWELVPE